VCKEWNGWRNAWVWEQRRGESKRLWGWIELNCFCYWLPILLRSTKWNANLILTCGFSELVSLCTVLGWKKPHSCKDTKMATPLDFYRGMSRPGNWYRLMLRHVIRHVANMWVCEQAMWARLSDGSFFDFFPFSRHTPRYYVLSALDFGEFKRFDSSIYRNLRELSLFINTTWLWDDNRGNSYILIAFVD